MALWAIAKWAPVGFGLLPVVVAIAWAVIEGTIRPRLISHAEIEGLADATMVRHPDDPEEAAFIEEQAAWYRCESLEQGKWHRVRNVIRQRRASGRSRAI